MMLTLGGTASAADTKSAAVPVLSCSVVAGNPGLVKCTVLGLGINLSTTVTLPTVTLPPIVVPGPTETATVRVPGPTQTATVNIPGPTTTATIAEPGEGTTETTTATATVTRNAAPQPTETVTATPGQDDTTSGAIETNSTPGSDPVISLPSIDSPAEAVGYGLASILLILAITMIGMYTGWRMGRKSAEEEEKHFVRDLLDTVKITDRE